MITSRHEFTLVATSLREARRAAKALDLMGLDVKITFYGQAVDVRGCLAFFGDGVEVGSLTYRMFSASADGKPAEVFFPAPRKKVRFEITHPLLGSS